MGTTLEQRRRISRYAILVLFMFLVAGSLSTENHWPVFAAITGAADPPAPGGDVASAGFALRGVTSGSTQDTAQQLRDIAHNALSASGIGGSGPAGVDRPPEVAPLEFAAAAANPPANPPGPPNSLQPTGRPDVGPAGGGACGGGRGPAFTPPGCLVREVAWTLRGMSKEDRIATAHSLRSVAATAVASNKAAYPPPGGPDLLTLSGPPTLPERPAIPERPEIAGRPTLPERPNIPDPPGRPGH